MILSSRAPATAPKKKITGTGHPAPAAAAVSSPAGPASGRRAGASGRARRRARRRACARDRANGRGASRSRTAGRPAGRPARSASVGAAAAVARARARARAQRRAAPAAVARARAAASAALVFPLPRAVPTAHRVLDQVQRPVPPFLVHAEDEHELFFPSGRLGPASAKRLGLALIERSVRPPSPARARRAARMRSSVQSSRFSRSAR